MKYLARIIGGFLVGSVALFSTVGFGLFIYKCFHNPQELASLIAVMVILFLLSLGVWLLHYGEVT